MEGSAFIETERDALEAEIKAWQEDYDDLKKRVDSEYDRGVVDSAKAAHPDQSVAKDCASMTRRGQSMEIYEAILKLRRT